MQENKPSRVACLLLTELPYDALPRGGRHEELFLLYISLDTIVRRTLPRALVLSPWPWALTMEVVDAQGGGVLLDGVPLSNHLLTVWRAHGWWLVELEITTFTVRARSDLKGLISILLDFNLCWMTSHSSQLIYGCPRSSLWELSQSGQPNVTIKNGLRL